MLAAALVFSITLISYLPFYRSPLYQDQSLHLYIGLRWLKGEIPYRDYSLGPGPVLALIYALGGSLARGNERLFNLLSAAYVAAGNVGLFLAAREIYGPHGAVLASLLFAFYVFSPRLIGYRLPPETYALPPVSLAFYWLIHSLGGTNPAAALLCGAALASATLIRQSAYVYIPAALLVLTWAGQFANALWFLLALGAFHAFWIVYFAYHRALGPYLKSTLWYAISMAFFGNCRGPGHRRVDPMRQRGQRAFQLFRNNSLTIFPLYLLAIAGLVYDFSQGGSVVDLGVALFFLSGAAMIFPRFNFDCSYWLNTLPWAALAAGNALSLLYLGWQPTEFAHITAAVFSGGLLIFVIAFDYPHYLTLDPVKRDRLFDPQKTGHASWWPTFNKIGDYLRAHTREQDRILVLGHAARIYNESRRRAFTYMPSFVPFKMKAAGHESYDRFLGQIQADYPEVIVLAGHMPAFPFNPKPYLADLSEISEKSGIVYAHRKTMDGFPIFLADTEKSYIKAVIRGHFRNNRLKEEKREISEATLRFQMKMQGDFHTEALFEFIEALKKALRLEDLLFTVNEFAQTRQLPFSLDDFERLNLAVGEAQYHLGRTEEAEKTFQHLVRNKHDSWEGYNNLGVLVFGKGRFSEAEAIFKKVLSGDPDNPLARENLARIEEQLRSAAFTALP